jgi:hypothetical protein
MAAGQFFGVMEPQPQKLRDLAARKAAARALIDEQLFQGAPWKCLLGLAKRLGHGFRDLKRDFHTTSRKRFASSES